MIKLLLSFVSPIFKAMEEKISLLKEILVKERFLVKKNLIFF